MHTKTGHLRDGLYDKAVLRAPTPEHHFSVVFFNCVFFHQVPSGLLFLGQMVFLPAQSSLSTERQFFKALFYKSL